MRALWATQAYAATRFALFWQLAAATLGIFVCSVASAQVALDQFKPAPLASDGFAIGRPDVLKQRALSSMILLEYANDPLVFHSETGKQYTLVKHHLVLHAGVAVGLWERVTAFVSLPVNLVMMGDDDAAAASEVPKADGPGIGDFTFGGRMLILGDASERIQVAGELIARLPTAQLANSGQTYAGDRVGSYEPGLIGELHFRKVELRGRGAFRFRKPYELGDLRIGTDLLYAYAMRVHLARNVYGHGELFGASNFEALRRVQVTPFEILAGVKYERDAWYYGGAIGPGLKWGSFAGYGAPDFRIIASVGYAPIEKVEPVRPRDRDGDGLLDPDDRCPLDPEDKDGFEDLEGCSDPDNDQDTVLDVDDACPMEPEDRDGFEDADGCPDPDNDEDGQPDVVDQCPNEPEDRDDFEDQDGCPDPDNDHDTVLDPDDACPLVPGVVQERGCPSAVRLDLDKGEIVLLKRVEFEVSKDVLLPESMPILEEVKAVLNGHPALKKVRVEGHTDARGKPAKNLTLSKGRARSVVRWLVENGVALERLEAYGCGQNRPRATNDTAEGRQTNRRTEFHIVDPAPAEASNLIGCQPADLADLAAPTQAR